jgi:hypothetical protein
MSVPPVEENRAAGYAGTATETVIPFASATVQAGSKSTYERFLDVFYFKLQYFRLKLAT